MNQASGGIAPTGARTPTGSPNWGVATLPPARYMVKVDVEALPDPKPSVARAATLGCDAYERSRRFHARVDFWTGEECSPRVGVAGRRPYPIRASTYAKP
ncbi:hypothetical protein GCM10010985_43100 [Caballeronia grimmiae]|uniref:Uncharacterized protein n=1 Tax=Caballeronia grimmiae TaxID=1071679 RepID=A0ABQ1RVA6_9BURK|nr:hypothetical protein GCM10010985_43100 [Caballeronia grimmiae]